MSPSPSIPQMFTVESSISPGHYQVECGSMAVWQYGSIFPGHYQVEYGHPQGDPGLLPAPHADEQSVEAVGLPVLPVPGGALM